MRRLKLEYLLWHYKNEMINGNYKHVKDLIAIMVLLDLSYIFPIYNYYNLNIITLDFLIDKRLQRDGKYKVPSYEDLDLIKIEYEKKLKKKKIENGVDKYNAAITWLEYMLEFKLIKENDIIDLRDYRLTDFMDDNRLIRVFKNDVYIDTKYNNKFNRILKK